VKLIYNGFLEPERFWRGGKFRGLSLGCLYLHKVKGVEKLAFREFCLIRKKVP
jgi:hypothetical protein